MVRLERDGEAVRLGKRSGDLVELGDLIDEVGPDVARLTYLLAVASTARQTIDLDLVTAQSNENPVFYVQYANARIHSIGRKAAEAGIERAPLADVDLVAARPRARARRAPQAVGAARGRSRWPCTERAPHKVTTWVRELADRFHGFYHDCYVIGDVPPELTQARLWLVEAARGRACAIGLDLLGVSAPRSPM